MTQDPTSRPLGEAVKDARLARRWSKERAAREARIDSTTWKRVEDGLSVQEHNLRAIEEALGWPVGQAYRLKAGDGTPGRPEPDPGPEVDLSPGELQILRAQEDINRTLRQIVGLLEHREQPPSEGES